MALPERSSYQVTGTSRPDRTRPVLRRAAAAAPRIVVGVDDSEASRAAVMWAAREARRYGGELVIVHAWDEPRKSWAPYAPATWRHDPECERVQGDAIARRAVAVVRERLPGLMISTRVCRACPAGALLELAADADLLVLGSGAHRAGDGRLGSVLLACLRNLRCPVVVVPPDIVAWEQTG